jgi:AhpD family alkylhydroperoxidase
MPARQNYMQTSPTFFKKYQDFSAALKSSNTLEGSILSLIDIRASQLNGCAFCLDMHVKEAKIRGERDLRVHHVAIWRESPLFNVREKAALAWTEALTHLSHEGISDAQYAAAREHLSENELSDLTFAVMSINGWNRLNAAFRNPPGSADKFFGLDKAGLNYGEPS